MRSIKISLMLQHEARLVWWFTSWGHLTGPRSAEVAGKTLFLGVSGRELLEEVSIWICKSKQDSPYQCRWAPSNLLRAWMEPKMDLLSQLELRHPSSPALWHQYQFSSLQTQTGTYTINPLIPWPVDVDLHHQLPWFSDLQAWTRMTPLAFLGLQLVDG